MRCKDRDPMSSFFPNIWQKPGLYSPGRGKVVGMCACVKSWGRELWQGSLSGNNQVHEHASRAHAEPWPQPSPHSGAIWPTDVAHSQPLMFLGNEQGQERPLGFCNDHYDVSFVLWSSSWLLPMLKGQPNCACRAWVQVCL